MSLVLIDALASSFLNNFGDYMSESIPEKRKITDALQHLSADPGQAKKAQISQIVRKQSHTTGRLAQL